MSVRAGGYGLALLAVPLHVQILAALTAESQSLASLRRSIEAAPQTTLRTHLRTLTALGIVERHGNGRGSGNDEFGLSESGQSLSGVGQTLGEWLTSRPAGQVEIGQPPARSAVKALVDGWSSAIIRALVARPLTLTELDRLIQGVSYPMLERRLRAMRIEGQIHAHSGKGRTSPYTVSRWLRAGVAPLISSAIWESRYLGRLAPPIRRLDVDGVFLLAIPLLSLDPTVSGVCRLSVGLWKPPAENQTAGVRVDVETGRVVGCSPRPRGRVDAWVDGELSAWLRAATNGYVGPLKAGGERQLSLAILEQLNSTVRAPFCAS